MLQVDIKILSFVGLFDLGVVCLFGSKVIFSYEKKNSHLDAKQLLFFKVFLFYTRLLFYTNLIKPNMNTKCIVFTRKKQINDILNAKSNFKFKA
jgi:hypothetical protein